MLAIDSENLEMLELLVIMGVETKGALLYAINIEFVEAVEFLLEHEELIHVDGDLYVRTFSARFARFVALFFSELGKGRRASIALYA